MSTLAAKTFSAFRMLEDDDMGNLSPEEEELEDEEEQNEDLGNEE